jgi:hypothetical protein
MSKRLRFIDDVYGVSRCEIWEVRSSHYDVQVLRNASLSAH